MKKAIVTGATGFIGKFLVRELVKQNVEVIAVVRRGTKNLNTINALPVKIVECNIADYHMLPDMIADRDIDVVFHIAWQGVSDLDARNEAIQMQNLQSTLDLIDAMHIMRIGCFIGCGSMHEAESLFEMNEDKVISNLGYMYKATKTAAHWIGKAKCGTYGIRFFWPLINTYGEEERSARLVNTIIRKVLHGESPDLSAGNQYYDCKKRRTKMKEPETGKKEKTGKSGYSITTWRLHLWCRHPEWLRTTQEFYNRIAEFYYNLLLDHTDLWELGSQQTLRELEIMSIPGRGGRIPSDPIPWQKVPLYFRRAAANEGIASAKSYLSRFAQDEKIGRAEKLNAAVTYYKGMYQDFSAKEITLRVWTGDTWTWMHCRLSGRDFPENARLMSPSVVFEYKYDMLHVPVRQNNENTATVRQRMQAGCRILCIQFTNSDLFWFRSSRI